MAPFYNDNSFFDEMVDTEQFIDEEDVEQQPIFVETVSAFAVSIGVEKIYMGFLEWRHLMNDTILDDLQGVLYILDLDGIDITPSLTHEISSNIHTI